MGKGNIASKRLSTMLTADFCPVLPFGIIEVTLGKSSLVYYPLLWATKFLQLQDEKPKQNGGGAGWGGVEYVKVNRLCRVYTCGSMEINHCTFHVILTQRGGKTSLTTEGGDRVHSIVVGNSLEG